MAWKIRPSGRAYLYKKERIDGRVKSIYVPVDRALTTYQADLERRNAIQAARRQAVRDRSIVEATTQALHKRFDQMLAQAGYHIHRGELRKKRNMQTSLLVQNQEVISSPAQLHTEPASDLAYRAVLLMVEGAEPQIRDEIVAEFNRVMSEVGATASGPLEKLLAQEVALTWIELFRLRMGYAAVPPAQAAFRTRSFDSAQLRWLRSVEMLRRIQQRLVMPASEGQ